MSLTVHELEAEARHLTAAERAELAQRLFASLEDEAPAGSEAEVEQAWFDDADRRYESYLAGETRSGATGIDGNRDGDGAPAAGLIARYENRPRTA